jgi:tryptophan 2,3-dioxygenase
MCTDVDLLIPAYLRNHVKPETNLQDKFGLLYWQEAGFNRETNKKNKTLTDFEQKYMPLFVQTAEQMQTLNLNQRYKNMLPKLDEAGKTALVEALRAFDRKYNIDWPMVHLETARTYLKSKGETKTATGGSHWEKYLHPAFQRRIYFPELWSESELAAWGTSETEKAPA